MQRLGMTIVAGAAMFVSANAGAQLRTASSDIPPGHMPPAGMCRVWYDGVAPGRQPAPTDCATARAQVRPGSRLVYGPTTRGGYDPRTRRERDGWYDSRSDRERERERERERYERLREHQRREWEKEERRREKEREKAWKKAHKHHGGYGRRDDDDDDDDDDDRRDRGRNGTDQGTWRRPGTVGGTIGRGTIGTGSGTCVDANHDGVCDSRGTIRVP